MVADPLAPRRLLARLRGLMAGAGGAQERLDQVVRIIAEDMVAEVCSCYVMRAGEVLELFATRGLLPEAVHRTRLQVGEGLVGMIAGSGEPLSLPDAWAHPAFAYRPETGEEPFRSFVGVPILRATKVIGVLVVQNRVARQYSDEEVETLETVAMVLSELLQSGDLVPRDELFHPGGNALLPARIDGVRLVPGLGIGQAVMLQSSPVIRRLIAEDPRIERERLRMALAEMHESLDRLLETQAHSDGEHREILEAYRMFAADAGWIARIGDAISSGLTAEAAVLKAHDDARLRLGQATDPYLRDRMWDLRDLANRLLGHLAGGAVDAPVELPDHAILVGRTLGPAELLDFDAEKVKGIVLEDGSPTMHAAIVARALNIPMVARLPDLLARIEAQDQIIVDGDNGQIVIRPGEDVLDLFQASLGQRQRRQRAFAALRDLPAETLDGVRVRLMLNAGLVMDMAQLGVTGADGVGLYRTELPFLERPSLPDVAVQTDIYRRIYDYAGSLPVSFRTLDVGSDKVLPYWHPQEEPNPAMGWRSIRISLERPALLRQQLRALIMAAAGRELRVMFPMIASIAELDGARHLLDLELRRQAERGGEGPARVQVGTMIEVPALLMRMEALLDRVDFVSVGTNDLLQFLFATDRGNARLSGRYDPLSPAALLALRGIVEATEGRGVDLSICGEMAGSPLDAMALVALGYRCLSMAAPGLGPVKAMIRTLPAAAARAFVEEMIRREPRNPRQEFRDFAIDHGVTIA